MSQLTPEHLMEQVLTYIREDVEGCMVSESDGRVGCSTPLEYPDGDNVVVWVVPYDSRFEVTDYGEATPEPAEFRGQDRRSYEELAQQLARSQGVELDKYHRITASCDLPSVAECVWRVATAAANIAQLTRAAHAFRARRPSREREFVHQVEDALVQRKVSVERERKIEGRSGHEYTTTIFLPKTESVIEPVGAHWNQATAAYVQFGDLRNANGYRLYALLDDRKGAADEDAANLLTQVSSVVQWSRRLEWLDQLH
jgi:hypothetical protein